MITFHRLELSNFRGIEKASVEFTAGLNILYGPNELGKSSLLIAIRAALLLPTTSSETRDFKSWGLSSVPTVTLYFSVSDVEYRIYKPFGSGTRSSAQIDRINGNNAFNLARGANVDKELRRLIEWGIPEPGRGAPRGLPQSYLTNALLGMQDEVEQVLRTDVSDDRSDSGLNSLTKALGTIGQDPLTSELINTLEKRTAKVFTPTGQIKRTGDSPLNQLTQDTIAANNELERLNRDLKESDEIEANIATIRSNAIRCEHKQQRLESLVNLAQDAIAAEVLIKQFQSKELDIQDKRSLFTEQEKSIKKLQADLDIAQNTTEKTENELRVTETSLTGVKARLRSIDQVSSSEIAAKKSKLNADIADIENKIKNAQSMLATREDLRKLTVDRENTNNKLSLATRSLQTAEQQLHFAKLQTQKEYLETSVRSLQQARDERNSTVTEVNKLEEELATQNHLICQSAKLLELRTNLDTIVNSDSELGQTKAMRQEAQNQFDEVNRELQRKDAESNALRDHIQQLREQVASNQGRQHSNKENANTATHNRQRLLQNNIDACKQRIASAEQALKLQQEISATEHYIDQLNEELVNNHRNLDRASSEVRRRRGRDTHTRHSGGHGQGTTAKQLGQIPGIAITVIATLACVASWFGGYFTAGLIAAPVVAMIGFIATFLMRHNDQPSQPSILNHRHEPTFDSGYQSDHERLGMSADEMRRGSERLAIAEADLHRQQQRYRDLRDFLNADPSDVLDQENAKIKQAQYDLDHLDQHHNNELHKLQQSMFALEKDISNRNDELDSLIAEQARLQSDHQAAQSNLFSFNAKVEHLVTNSHHNPNEVESEFKVLAAAIQANTSLRLDHSSVESIQQFKQRLVKIVDGKNQLLKTTGDRLAACKAEIKNKEQSSPEISLENVQSEIFKVIREQPEWKSTSLTVAEANKALESAKDLKDTEQSKLHIVDGQIQALQTGLPDQANSITQETVEKLYKNLESAQQASNEATSGHQERRTQLENEQRTLVVKTKSLTEKLEQERNHQKNLSDELTSLRSRHGNAQGVLQELVAAKEELDITQAQATIESVLIESNGAINNKSPLNDQLQDFSNKLALAKIQTIDQHKELNQHHGKLDMIGGAVLADRVRRQQETYNRLSSEALEFQYQCEAEKYLLEVITDEDDKHTDHLGRVLAKPVSTKFSELTGNRYGAFTLDPQLTAQTINAEGEARQYEQLSIGSRQQLAVLVKLALAAQLKSTVVLDDQLVHSDPKRLQWFRQALQTSARDFEHQVIVLTCRPDDYRSNDANTVNLGECVDRVITAA